LASSDIGQLVTNQQTSGWIQNKLSLRTQKQAEIRLSVERVTSVFSDSVTGMIRAVMYSRNLNLLFEEVCKHPVGKLQILAFDVVASRDTRLIGNYNKKYSNNACAARQRSKIRS
jgi:hypothetical protein